MGEREPMSPNWGMIPESAVAQTTTATVEQTSRLGRFMRTKTGMAVLATGALAIPSVAGANMLLSDNDNDGQEAMGVNALDEIDESTFDEECDVPAYDGVEHRDILGNNAFYAYDLNETDENIQKTLQNTLSRNIVGIASAKSLLDGYSTEVAFDSLEKEMNDLAERMKSDDKIRAEACEQVLASAAVDAQRVNVSTNGMQFMEIVPVYAQDGSLANRPINIVEVPATSIRGNEAGVEGIWVGKTEYGQAAIVMTPDGRLFIVKTTGEETGAADITPDTVEETVPASVTPSSNELPGSAQDQDSSDKNNDKDKTGNDASDDKGTNGAGTDNGGNNDQSGPEDGKVNDNGCDGEGNPDCEGGDENGPDQPTPATTPGTPASSTSTTVYRPSTTTTVPRSTTTTIPRGTTTTTTSSTSTTTTIPRSTTTSSSSTTTSTTSTTTSTTIPRTTTTTAPATTTTEALFNLRWCDQDEPRVGVGGYGVIKVATGITAQRRNEILADPMNITDFTDIGNNFCKD